MGRTLGVRPDRPRGRTLLGGVAALLAAFTTATSAGSTAREGVGTPSLIGPAPASQLPRLARVRQNRMARRG